MARILISAAAAAILSGCATQPGKTVQDFFRPASKGSGTLTTALKQYDDGDYADSAKNFQSALDQGLAGKERVNAHKHLAFINCASNRERQCRDEFRKALAADPSMELAPAEAGHPIWGPIFRSLKAGR
jgi:Tfp pilus assembly protein PilF